MGIGLAISSILMLVVGFIEIKRRNMVRNHSLADDPSAVVPISALRLVPQFCIAGLGEAYHTMGHLEFFYDQFPPNMRNTAIVLSSCTSAVGRYLSTIVVIVVHNTTGGHGKMDWLDDNFNRGYLHYIYWLLSAMEAVNLLYLMVCAYLYKYTESPVQDLAATRTEEITANWEPTD